MKKGFSIIALILAMVLLLTLFSGNKAEAYYGGYGYRQPYAYGQPYAGYGYVQPYGVYGYNQPYTGYGYGQPYAGYGYGQPYTGFGYGQPYAGYGYNQPYAGYGYALDVMGTEGGVIIVPARVGEPGSPVTGIGVGGSPAVSNPPQSQPQPAPASIFPPPVPIVAMGPGTYPGTTYPQPRILPPAGTGPITYPVYPAGSGPLWPDFSAMPSSTSVFPWAPAYPVNPYGPNYYPTVPYPTPSGNIRIPW